MSDAPIISDERLLGAPSAPWEPPPGWEIVRLIGGAHDGARFWSHRPPKRFRVIAAGDVYELREPGVYVAEGHPYEPAETDEHDQLTIK